MSRLAARNFWGKFWAKMPGNRQLLCEILQLKLQKFYPPDTHTEKTVSPTPVYVCVKNGQIATNMAHINYDKMALMSSHTRTHFRFESFISMRETDSAVFKKAPHFSRS